MPCQSWKIGCVYKTPFHKSNHILLMTLAVYWYRNCVLIFWFVLKCFSTYAWQLSQIYCNLFLTVTDNKESTPEKRKVCEPLVFFQHDNSYHVTLKAPPVQTPQVSHYTYNSSIPPPVCYRNWKESSSFIYPTWKLKWPQKLKVKCRLTVWKEYYMLKVSWWCCLSMMSLWCHYRIGCSPWINTGILSMY